jgi:DNA-binding transcriptional regulator LsrR (DeoR family)
MLHTVAKLHYESDMSQVLIAKQLGVSTATISRLLQRARSEGIVRIEVRDIFAPDALGKQVAARLGLRQVDVVDAPPQGVAQALVVPLAQMLRGLGLRADDVLMIGWGQTVRAVIEAGLPQLPGVLVVPSTGGLQQHAPQFQINEFARLVADATGGVPNFIHAPYLPAAAALEMFLADNTVRESVALWDRIDVAVVGIGMPYKIDTSNSGISGESAVLLANAVGDVVRHYFDADGRVINWEGEGRMIAVSADQLRRARTVVGMAVGEAKAGSIIGAARAGLVDWLITDTRTAEAILDRLEPSA